jgi:DNA-binding GntR family transcriptional regulator
VNSRRAPWRSYVQIAATLRQHINDGKYRRGSFLPSESALCEALGVARNTVRRALSILENEGLIETVTGKGRIVRYSNEGDSATVSARSAPQYRRIADDLRAEIERGHLVAGDVLPSEAKLMEQHRASRGTVRHALAILEAAHLIDTVHGKGRFVRRRP